MSVKEIESAIARLSPTDLAQLAAWFEEFQAGAWDEQIENDVRLGRLDPLTKEAEEEFKAGRHRPL
jgi:hypothetical protein